MTMTLTAFLLARIAEDEAVAGFDPEAEPWLLYRVGHTDRCDYPGDMPGYCTCGKVARVLAECQAKRRIVVRAKHLASLDNMDDETAGRAFEYDDEVLPNLAAVYADHPDYCEEWLP